jgi:hypothetical protein
MLDGQEGYGPIVWAKQQSSARLDSFSFAQHLDALTKVVRKQGIFSQVKVLLTVRRQDTKLASEYAQVSDRVRGTSQEHFKRWAQYIASNPVGFHLGGGQKLDYNSWCSRIVDVIGKSNMLVLSLEHLRSDEYSFLKSWLDFIGVNKIESVLDSTVNSQRKNVRSSSDLSWSLRTPIRTGPNLRPTRLFLWLGLPKNLPARWPDFFREEQIYLTSDLSEQVLASYTEGNRSLDQNFPSLNLQKHGYY